MTTPRTKKVIVRSNTGEIKDVPEAVLRTAGSVVSTVLDEKSVEPRSVTAEEKHLHHYKRRMEALHHGAVKLLDGIDMKGPARDKLEAKLKDKHDELIKNMEKIEREHESKLDAKYHQEKVRLASAKWIHEQQIMKCKEAIAAPENKNNPKKIEEQKKIMADAKVKLAEVNAGLDAINKNLGDINPYQEELQKYYKEVKKLLHEEAYIPSSKIKKALGRAEEYAELAEGRPPLVTVTPFDADPEKYPDGVWLVQIEVPQDPLSAEQKEELLWTVSIVRKNEDPSYLPQWYKEMSEYEKKLFFETFKDVYTTEQIEERVPAISSKLRSIPGVANFSRHTTILMDKDGNEISRNVLSRSSHVASRDMKDAALRAKTTEDNINHVINNMLEEKASQLAQLWVDGHGTLDGADLTVPVLVQTLITPENKMGPDAALLKDRDEAIKRMLEKDPTRKVKVQVMVDGERVTKEIVVKLDMFATNHPLNELRYYGAGTGRFGAVRHDTEELSSDPNQRDMQRLTKFAAQYMLNYQGDFLKSGRGLYVRNDLTDLTKITDEELNFFRDNYVATKDNLYYFHHDGSFKKVQFSPGTGFDNFILKSSELHADVTGRIPLSKEHIEEYIIGHNKNADSYQRAYDPSKSFPLLFALYNQANYVAPRMATEIQDKELYFSSLQQLMAAEMGIAYGSCVSGKDRKGIQTMYTDSMKMYYDLYGHLPPPAATGSEENRKNRANFVRLFAQVYVTRHQHENAGQNAKGSDGLKTPLFYLPKDMLVAVVKATFNEFIHKQCDRLASNNEVGKLVIGKLKKFKKGVANTFKGAASSAASIFSHLTGGAKEAKEVLDAKANSSATPIVNSVEQQLVVKRIQELILKLPENDSLRNATGIKELRKRLIGGPGVRFPSLHELAEICLKRVEDSDKSRDSLEIYKAIIDLARNPASKSGDAVLFKHEVRVGLKTEKAPAQEVQQEPQFQPPSRSA